MNNEIDWQSIVTFEAVARLGTFTLAAEELNILQPSVSRRIAGLEAELGVHLFFRTRPRVTLTNAGENLLTVSQDVIRQMSEGLAMIKHRADDSPVVFNTTIGFASSFLLPRLNEFSVCHPKLNIEIISRDVNDEYDASNADLITVFGRAEQVPGVRSRLIHREEMIAVAAPIYLRRTGSNSSEHQLLHLVSGGYEDDWRIFFAGKERDVPEARSSQKFTSYMVYLHAALNGQGVALGQRFMLKEYLNSGTLVQVFPWSTVTERGYFVSLTSKGVQHEPARLFADWLVGLANQPEA